MLYRNEGNRVDNVRPQSQTYSFHSSTVTYGGANGAYYTSSSTRRMGGDGVSGFVVLCLVSMNLFGFTYKALLMQVAIFFFFFFEYDDASYHFKKRKKREFVLVLMF